jgi:hypothetical protein
MATTTAHSARGKVTSARDGTIVFIPSGTNYELSLLAADFTGPLTTLVEGHIRVTARKVWSVPSGGNFIAPIFGPPKIVQGRLLAVEGNTLIVQAGAPVVVELPADGPVVDLPAGPITIGSMVNVTCLPGARFELIGPVGG